MCFGLKMTVKMNLFKWGRKRDLSSSLDARWGDPAISAPNEGSWNEMPPVQPIRTEPTPVRPSKPRRFVTMLRSKASDSTEPVETGAASSVQGVRNTLPHHPLVDLKTAERGRDQTPRPDTARRTPSRTDHRQENTAGRSSPEDGRPESRNGSECSSEPDESAHTNETTAETRARPATDTRKSPPWPKSPPLAATARMRRYSEQSMSVSTDRMTPSTGTFSSRHTSITSATSAGSSSAASALPLLAEESPPVPKLAAMAAAPPPPPPPSHSHRDHQTGRSATAGRAHQKRRDPEPVGPQELVPSYDELWGW